MRRVLVSAILLAALLDFAANWLAAHYLIAVGTFLIPAGTFAFGFAFATYDFIRRQGGLVPTVAAVLLGFAASIVYALVFGGGVGRIAVAGLIALACSSSVDLVMQTLTLRWPIWSYVGASNLVSLLIDSVVFVTIAFAMLPPPVQVHILEGQYLAKAAVTVLTIPLVYGARRALPTRPSRTAEVAA